MRSHIADIWESIADEIGDAPALVHDSTIRSWTQFEDRAAVVGGVGLQVAATPFGGPCGALRDDRPEGAPTAPVGHGRPAVQATEFGAGVELDTAH